jgi:hypothetical protein
MGNRLPHDLQRAEENRLAWVPWAPGHGRRSNSGPTCGSPGRCRPRQSASDRELGKRAARGRPVRMVGFADASMPADNIRRVTYLLHR